VLGRCLSVVTRGPRRPRSACGRRRLFRGAGAACELEGLSEDRYGECTASSRVSAKEKRSCPRGRVPHALGLPLAFEMTQRQGRFVVTAANELGARSPPRERALCQSR
jgi:hypothetical protein